MRRTPSAKVGSEGVTHTQLAVQDVLGWLFREQPTEDYGIDAHVEVVERDDVRGRLLALQIKSGESQFRESGPSGWWFRPDAEHVQYWLNHSLPVVVVLYHPATKRCHWQLVNRKTLQETSTGGWKLLVPEDQVLDGSATVPLSSAAKGDSYVLRIRELQLARHWMERLSRGQRLVIDIAEWVNKSSGRGSISLGVDNEDGQGPEKLASWGVFLGLSDYAEVVPRLFAWADVHLHEETYDEAAYNLFETECSVWDEGDRFLTEDFGDWRQGRFPEGLRPYTDDGEIGYWRLELTLNELGRAFLVVDKFGMEGWRLLT
jgi:hypothetical protein